MDKLDFWEDFSPHILEPIKEELILWLSQHMADEEKQELIDLIFSYKGRQSLKTTGEYTKKRLGKHWGEREAKIKKYTGKLGLELIKTPTTKGHELMDLLMDLGHNPQDYFYNPVSVTATQEDIKDYLKEIGIRKEPKQDLLNIIKK